jgi:hypothetical protein
MSGATNDEVETTEATATFLSNDGEDAEAEAAISENGSPNGSPVCSLKS